MLQRNAHTVVKIAFPHKHCLRGDTIIIMCFGSRYVSVTFAMVVMRFICLRFSLRVFSILGSYKLRRIRLHCLRSHCDFFPRQTRTKPYKDHVYIVPQPQGYCALIVFSSRPPYINRTMPVRWPCRSRKESVR